MHMQRSIDQLIDRTWIDSLIVLTIAIKTGAEPRSQQPATKHTCRILTPALLAAPRFGWGRCLSSPSSSSLALAATTTAAAAAEEQKEEKQEEEEDLSKKRLGRVEAAGILDGLIEALRIQQVRFARMEGSIDPDPGTNPLINQQHHDHRVTTPRAATTSTQRSSLFMPWHNAAASRGCRTWSWKS
jgi:hypothetical protein